MVRRTTQRARNVWTRTASGIHAQRRRNRNMIGGGGVREAAKHRIVCTKRLRAKVKNWGAPLGSTALVHAIRLTL